MACRWHSTLSFIIQAFIHTHLEPVLWGCDQDTKAEQAEAESRWDRDNSSGKLVLWRNWIHICHRWSKAGIEEQVKCFTVFMDPTLLFEKEAGVAANSAFYLLHWFGNTLISQMQQTWLQIFVTLQLDNKNLPTLGFPWKQPGRFFPPKHCSPLWLSSPL